MKQDEVVFQQVSNHDVSLCNGTKGRRSKMLSGYASVSLVEMLLSVFDKMAVSGCNKYSFRVTM